MIHPQATTIHPLPLTNRPSPPQTLLTTKTTSHYFHPATTKNRLRRPRPLTRHLQSSQSLLVTTQTLRPLRSTRTHQSRQTQTRCGCPHRLPWTLDPQTAAEIRPRLLPDSCLRQGQTPQIRDQTRWILPTPSLSPQSQSGCPHLTQTPTQTTLTTTTPTPTTLLL